MGKKQTATPIGRYKMVGVPTWMNIVLIPIKSMQIVTVLGYSGRAPGSTSQRQ
jgi:hypothetical protein